MRTEQEKTSTQKIADFADKSLLIVDDDNPLRDRLARAMEKKGFVVTQAESVEQGINKAKNSPPAFAVVVLRLNDGNGLEVVKEIQKIKKDSSIQNIKADYCGGDRFGLRYLINKHSGNKVKLVPYEQADYIIMIDT